MARRPSSQRFLYDMEDDDDDLDTSSATEINRLAHPGLVKKRPKQSTASARVLDQDLPEPPPKRVAPQKHNPSRPKVLDLALPGPPARVFPKRSTSHEIDHHLVGSRPRPQRSQFQRSHSASDLGVDRDEGLEDVELRPKKPEKFRFRLQHSTSRSGIDDDSVDNSTLSSADGDANNSDSGSDSDFVVVLGEKLKEEYGISEEILRSLPKMRQASSPVKAPPSKPVLRRGVQRSRSVGNPTCQRRPQRRTSSQVDLQHPRTSAEPKPQRRLGLHKADSQTNLSSPENENWPIEKPKSMKHHRRLGLHKANSMGDLFPENDDRPVEKPISTKFPRRLGLHKADSMGDLTANGARESRRSNQSHEKEEVKEKPKSSRDMRQPPRKIQSMQPKPMGLERRHGSHGDLMRDSQKKLSWGNLMESRSRGNNSGALKTKQANRNASWGTRGSSSKRVSSRSVRNLLGVAATSGNHGKEEKDDLPTLKRVNSRRNCVTGFNLHDSDRELNMDEDRHHHEQQRQFGEETLRQEILSQRLKRLGLK